MREILLRRRLCVLLAGLLLPALVRGAEGSIVLAVLVLLGPAAAAAAAAAGGAAGRRRRRGRAGLWRRQALSAHGGGGGGRARPRPPLGDPGWPVAVLRCAGGRPEWPAGRRHDGDPGRSLRSLKRSTRAERSLVRWITSAKNYELFTLSDFSFRRKSRKCVFHCGHTKNSRSKTILGWKVHKYMFFFTGQNFFPSIFY